MLPGPARDLSERKVRREPGISIRDRESAARTTRLVRQSERSRETRERETLLVDARARRAPNPQRRPQSRGLNRSPADRLLARGRALARLESADLLALIRVLSFGTGSDLSLSLPPRSRASFSRVEFLDLSPLRREINPGLVEKSPLSPGRAMAPRQFSRVPRLFLGFDANDRSSNNEDNDALTGAEERRTVSRRTP